MRGAGTRLTALVLSLLLLISLCGCGKRNETQRYVAVVTSGSSDNADYDAAALSAAEQWCGDNGLECRRFTPASAQPDSVAETMTEAWKGGAVALITAGSAMETAVYQFQSANAKSRTCPVLLLDGEPHDVDYNYETGSRVHCILFQEEQAGFLAGYAAVMSGARKLGALGGVQLTGVIQYLYGFLQGADTAARRLELEEGSVTVHYSYTDSFFPSAEAEALCSSWYRQGVSVILSDCGKGQQSVLAAATQSNSVILTGLSPSDDPKVLFTAEKRLDRAVSRSLDQLKSNDWAWPEGFGGETEQLGAAEECVGLSVSESDQHLADWSYEDYLRLEKLVGAGNYAVSDSIKALPDLTIVHVITE